MRIAMGSDHAGFDLKEHLKDYLQGKGQEVIDVGTHSTERVDYPIYGAAAARKVVDGEAVTAIVVCGTGVGIGISANKVHGIRCAITSDVYTARMSRAHNNANVLALGGRVIADGLAEEIVDVWLATDFEGGRHARRVGEITAVEDGQDITADDLDERDQL
ncbi:ribose 5-phosphate isomerase B [Propionibacterium freudenreichii]|uniref:ribose 5-phosphate isomerase B n=1 Tax=Propionibacterium freudenreichii TaxID=1744 RepID=UPI000BC2CC29|nr:ribose 5-phosphate isomerase B [Propionibacterium freudenreichii]MDK9295014.1 ribose 5-phosphate isomerase B [Propionibacterium freudenreichii]MDK9360382.1 ribose 5-phosphate isomerase B [Propionibacterium freudenreichii]MDK9659950.1 ribose 5-phosphate isomerase B [Propionibacterium freudenreichii]SCQ76804.1 Ribose-5-phosphate isomerase B [Propionibacterium freudenreichii]SCQ83383.1 Ribose-5-phosphate isomerase B [Propionibacterium freudenreichii]